MIRFVVFDPETGLIQQFGTCPPDDLAVQGAPVIGRLGETLRPAGDVLALEDLDAAITDATHRVDVVTRTLIPLEP